MTADQTSFGAVDPAITDTADAILRRHCDPSTLAAGDAGAMPGPLWTAFEASGLHLIGVDEDAGGSGGSAVEFAAVLYRAGAAVAPIPLAENNVAAWVLSQVGLPVPAMGPLTIAIAEEAAFEGAPTGVLTDVAWAPDAAGIVVIAPADGAVVVASVGAVPAIGGHAFGGRGIDGTPLGTVDLGVAGATDVVRADASLLSAFVDRRRMHRLALLAGALSRLTDMTVDFARTRHQFGKAIGSFQAVQQHLVALAQTAAMVSMAAQEAATLIAQDAPQRDVRRALTAAAIMVDLNVAASILSAHQVHGAIGLSQEYALQHVTRRARAWASDVVRGTDVCGWGEALLDSSADGLYPAIVDV